MTRLPASRYISAIASLLIAASISSAQAQHAASIAGRVSDPQAATVVGATVKLIRPASSFTQETATSEQGEFQFSLLNSGAYTLTAEAPGFTPVSRDVAIFRGRSTREDLQFLTVSSEQQITVVATAPGATTPDPAERFFVHDDLLEPNPGRPGAPISIPGLPIETASGGIKAPQYFAPGVAGDHGEPIAQFFQIGDFLFPNNLPANTHGNGYSDPNFLISNGIGTVQADGGAFNVREGSHSVSLSTNYGLRDRLQPFVQLTGDYRDADLVTGWSPQNPNTAGWLALEVSCGNGFLQRLEHRQQYKLNGHRMFKAGQHAITLFGTTYYGFSFIPGLIPIGVPSRGDTIDSRQQERTHNSLLVASDTWQLSAKQQFQFSGFFRIYGLQLRSNFGDGLIQQSEFRTVTGGDASYLFRPRREFSIFTGVDLRRDNPRGLDLKRADQNGVFQSVTSNDLTLGFVEPFISFDGVLSRYFRYDLGVRREEVKLDNVDKITAANSFGKLAGITLPKGTLTLLPPNRKFLPTTVAFSFGEAFHTNDPRIGRGASAPTIIVPSHAMQFVLSKDVARTDFRITLARVSNAQQLGKIDADSGLQQDVGPSLIRSLTVSARHFFSFGFLQASWARATAIDRVTGEDIPEAPRLIWDVSGSVNRLPFGLRMRSEYEAVGRKPLGNGFNALPIREFRCALLRSFRDGQMDLGVNALIAHGFTGQTLETLQLSGEPAPFERIVGVPLKSYVSLSWVYNFTRSH